MLWYLTHLKINIKNCILSTAVKKRKSSTSEVPRPSLALGITYSKEPSAHWMHLIL